MVSLTGIETVNITVRDVTLRGDRRAGRPGQLEVAELPGVRGRRFRRWTRRHDAAGDAALTDGRLDRRDGTPQDRRGHGNAARLSHKSPGFFTADGVHLTWLGAECWDGKAR